MRALLELVRAGVVGMVVLLATAASAAAAPASTVDWGWPLAGAPSVDRRFEPPTSIYGAGHRGVDLRAGVGELILAAGTGTVSYAGMLAGRGVVAVVHAGGLRTTYEPLTVRVRVGQHVDLGEVLGALTAGHASCRLGTTCLHWGLRRGDTYLDPLTLVGPSPVRLLPLAGQPAGRSAADGGRSPTGGASSATGGASSASGGASSASGGGTSASGGATGTLEAGTGAVAAAPARAETGQVDGSQQALAVAAAGGLAVGLALLAGRPNAGRPEQGRGSPAPLAPAPTPAPPVPVDLRSERERRRVG